MTLYDIFAFLIVLAALFGFFNEKYLKLPTTIGIMVTSIVCSLGIILLGNFHTPLTDNAVAAVSKIDFENVLMNAMLSFLLFAGSINVNLKNLAQERLPVMVFATLGTLLSTFLVGTASYYLIQVFGYNVDYIYCLLFGSLISPTDPIAVMGILKEAKIPTTIQVRITGESLFNDGIAIVIFITLFEIAKAGMSNFSFTGVSLLFLKEAVGGLALGFAIGYIGFKLLRLIDNYRVEVIITLGMVTGGYSLSHALGVSGPLAMVVAGLIVGNQGRKYAMSDTTKEYLDKFWEIIDELLNAILFTLLGIEILIVNFNLTGIEIGIISFFVLLAARYASVAFSMYVIGSRNPFQKKSLYMLTWGGLRGGISVALALSLSANMHREFFITVTYIIVLLSVVIQGLTIKKAAAKILGGNTDPV